MLTKQNFSNSQKNYLLSIDAIKERCQKIYELGKNKGLNFYIREEKLPLAADYVTQVIRKNYPDLSVPFHSRMRHFQVDNIDRINYFADHFSADKFNRAKQIIDLIVVSVLLDAGAGEYWQYFEKCFNKSYKRSEGLAIASFHMFLNGEFSSLTNEKLLVDSTGLKQFDLQKLQNGFQISDENPLVGASGRVGLLNNLAITLEKNTKYFLNQRPSGIVDYLLEKYGFNLSAVDIFDTVVKAFVDIWPGGLVVDGQNYGDVCHYSKLTKEDLFSSLVPFHKLSMWLSYSLMEPMIEVGFNVSDINQLTGLAEYRNGGLFFDLGVIGLYDQSLLQQKHNIDSDVVIEFRALTIVLLEKLSVLIRKKLNMSANDFPLAKVLQGGSWYAGREIADKLRTDGSPPLKINSKATVF